MGKHLILDVHSNDYERMNNKDFVRDFLNKCVELINMRKLIEPVVVEGATYNPGVTGFVIIETSHISIHTFSNVSRFNMDIYSCKTFDPESVKSFVLESFQQSRILKNEFLKRIDT